MVFLVSLMCSKPRKQAFGRVVPPGFLGRESIARVARFGVIGLLATATYFLTTVALGNPPVSMEPIAANTIGFILSVVVSYVGHHRFTFRMDGAHGYYFPRFISVTVVLFLLSTAAVAVFRDILGYSHTLVTATIAVSYPVASYALNFLWAFTRRSPG
jgi:putative flippase GtrA